MNLRNIIARIRVAYARHKLCKGVRLIASVNRQLANAHALWGDAQNVMEEKCPSPTDLFDLHLRLATLSDRAYERAEDVKAEQGISTTKVIPFNRVYKRRQTA